MKSLKSNLTIQFIGIVGLTFLVLSLFRKKRKMEISGGYVVPPGTPNMADALHSFERRKSDGFGGRMITQINEKLREMYRSGINPDVSKLEINVDSKNYSVTWKAFLEESKNGKAYVGLSTVGSAGSGADERAKNQIAKMKTWVDGAKDYELVLDFKNPKGIYIRQYFYKWTKPGVYPNN